MQVPAHHPKMIVTSSNTFWSSKEAIEGQLVQNDFIDLKARKGDLVEIGAAIFNESFTQKMVRKAKKLVLPGLAGVAATAAAVALGAVTAPIGLAIGASMLLTGATGVVGTSMMERIKASDVPEGLQLPHTAEKGFTLPVEGKSPSAALQALATQNMCEYPSSRHILHMNGHGHGAKSVAGIAADDAREAIEVVTKSQKKFDVALYETCTGSNFEFLHGQAPNVDFAVAFEDQIPKSNSGNGRLPLADILEVAVDAPTSKDAAIEMAKVAGSHFDRDTPAKIASVPLNQRLMQANRQNFFENTDSTSVAVDLKELRQELSPALGRVGTQLTKLLKSSPTYKGLFERAKMENSLESSNDLVDLGGFLKCVHGSLNAESPAALEIEKSLNQLDETIMYKRTGEKIPLSGLSFHTNPEKLPFSRPGNSAHADTSLPEGWVEFVENAF